MTSEPLLTDVLDTPAGPLAIVVDPAEDGAVVLSGYADLVVLLGFAAGAFAGRPIERSRHIGPAGIAVADYAAGDVGALDRVRVLQPGGPFRAKAWEAMRAIPAGRTISYAELAASAGSPTAVRAAGSACARNRVAPFVPCHRVVRSDGSLGGYAYGFTVKQALLRHEATWARQSG
ncbi:MAG: methylated-DNA--[protein]-cysteine S-methyltransferase [Actinomycetota bacterium]|nr:MAG: methylated-DNA--[protein]-cysteine S-methyltransferase [Actinomycetota bacterium]